MGGVFMKKTLTKTLFISFIFSVTVSSTPKKILRGVTAEATRESEDREVKMCLANVRNTEQFCESWRQYFSLSKENITEISELEKYCDSMHQCLQPNINIDRKDKFGVTALMRAIRVNNPWSIRLLLAKKSDANQSNQDRITPLILAARVNCLPETMQLLFAENADVNAQDNVDGYTPLILSTRYLSMANARLCLENGAAVNRRDRRGCTALMYAVRQCFEYEGKAQLDFIRLFRTYGADPYITNEKGESVVNLIKGMTGSYFEKVREALGLPKE